MLATFYVQPNIPPADKITTMTTETKTNIPQCAFDWYDEYAHGDIDRRTFLTRLASLAATSATLGAITAGLTPNYALAEQVSFNDSDIHATFELFDSPTGHGKGKGYKVVPTKAEGKALPTVLVVHENRGLNPYIKDVARRLAKAGFIAFAPDALYPLGGYPGNDDEGRKMQRSMDRDKIEQDFIAAAKHIHADGAGNSRLGVVGFCFGGYISNMLAAAMPQIVNAAVPFYGSPPKANIISNVKGPLLVQLAGLDKRINATWPDYKDTLTKNQATFEMHMYENVNHGFHNDSTSRYAPDEAELAWKRTLAFFNQHLVS